MPRPDASVEVARRLRVGALAAVLLAVGIAGYSVRPVRRGDWVTYTPTDILLTSQMWLGKWSSRHGRYELEARLDRAELSTRQRRALAGAAVGALRDDSGHRACSWGARCLRTLGDESIGEVEKGLASTNVQRRQLCASLLRDRVDGWWQWDFVGPMPEYRATVRLLEVTVEGLADDGWAWPVANATEGFYFLVEHSTEAESCLRGAMYSTDAQQQLLAAAAAAHGRVEGLAVRATQVLVEHLDDDEVGQNALLAAGALFALGEPARGAVEDAAMNAADRQRRMLSQLIVLEWKGPAASERELSDRRVKYGVSLHAFDAVREGRSPDYWISGIRGQRRAAVGP